MQIKKIFYFFVLTLFLLSCKKERTLPTDEDLSAPDFKLTISILSSSAVELSWQNPSSRDFQEVKILRNSFSHPLDLKDGLLIYSGTSQQFQDQGLTAGKRYYYTAFILNKQGITTAKSSLNILLTAPSLPLSFAALKKIEAATLYWQKPNDPNYTGVKIQRSDLKYPEKAEEGVTVYEGNALSFHDNGLEGGKTYYYSLFSSNEQKIYSLSYQKTTCKPWRQDEVAVDVQISSLQDNAVLKGEKIIESVVSSSSGIAIQKVEYYLDQTLVYETSVSPYTYHWNSDLVPQGLHTLMAKAYDALGVSGFHAISVRIDRSPPAISFLSPSEESHVSGQLLFKLSAEDAGGIKEIRLFMDQSPDNFALLSAPPYEITFNTDGLSETSHTVKAIASDFSDNTSETLIHFTVDRMPAVAVSPAENTTVSYKSKVILTFTEPMNSGSIESSFSLKDNLGNLITGVLSFDSEKKIFTFTPSSLTAEKTYTAKIVKEAKDLNGNMLASDKTWTFTTDSTSNIYGDPEAVFGITRYGN